MIFFRRPVVCAGRICFFIEISEKFRFPVNLNIRHPFILSLSERNALVFRVAFSFYFRSVLHIPAVCYGTKVGQNDVKQNVEIWPL